MSDQQRRELWRAGDYTNFLRAKIRAGEMSESMKRIFCALGYVPMVEALGLPGKASSAEKSFMVPKTFCNYATGRWLLGMDYERVAKYLCKFHWSRTMCIKIVPYDRITRGQLFGHQIVGGHHRISATEQANKRYYYLYLAQQLRKKEIRNDLIKALLTKLA